MMQAFKRIFTAGAKNFIRSGSVSFATVLIMTVTLSIIALLMFLSAMLSHTLESIESKVDVNVYFATSASESDVLQVQKDLETLDDVALVTYTSRETALAEFKERHSDDTLTLRALEELGENPLGASLSIKAKDPSQYEGIVAYLEGISGSSLIDRINYFQNKTVIDRLTSAIGATQQAGIIIVALFVIASIIIALATIRLAIYSSRDEIAVMRLVGASNMYIRGPFIVAGVLSGVFAAIITLILFYPAAWYAGQATAMWFGDFNIFTYYTSHFPFFFLVLMGSGMLLAGVASFLGVRRYLKI